ncbi:MAG: heavy-metal-associated domain-containing protein [Sulfurovum sp.]|nr:heavy-metal-associated domain-containing protein [Sulfurovum sp.]MCB4745302.1 heavy-metal-associated domain-containing protein [Sulfurovum sp.]MCB4746700.1 heavy-metal-associated domain-containing protein [Sulfurovum sp.]MCB4748600.1 heavy-metal-associated domain-containing protein [Sulfurovum sp.]MCB4750669.1 heavy-metal-associated domain-containing protein [Sulfurovum sp.]
MIQTFKVQNVKCGGCAHTLKEKLRPLFGEVEVDLEKEPRQIMLDIEESQIEILSKILKEIGYPFVGEKMGFMESGSAKAKSFISCAIGKINQ